MTPNLADQWLHEQLRAIRDWQDEEVSERARAGLDALEAAGAVPAASAARWREVFAARGGEAAVGAEVRERAAGLLSGLLDVVSADAEWDDPVVQRFEAACRLYGGLGAADGAAWDARLRERGGWPSAEEELADEEALNAGPRETELVEVIAGPEEVRGGHRLLVVLRFADGVAFAIDGEAPDVEWPEWRLVDDAGTSYWYRAGSFDEHGANVSFATAIPAGANWIELSLDDEPDVVFRVRVD